MIEHADLHGVAMHFIDPATILTTAPVEHRKRITHAQPQDAGNVISSAAIDGQTLSGLQIPPDINPGQAHVASSIPSRATVTISSISSGVITYGGMK